MEIRQIHFEEIPLLKDFAPPDWNSDISRVFSLHFGQPYFHPIVAEMDGKLAGCAQGLLNGDTGWLGNIIVLPPYRRQGIGCALTEALVRYFHDQGCQHQILTATEMGEPVYRQLGFHTVSYYVFLKGGSIGDPIQDRGIRPLEEGDTARVFELDRRITGEERSRLLALFLEKGWVYEANGKVDGFFLPSMGQGPVLADNDDSGLALLRLKHSLGCPSVIMPEANTCSRDYFQKAGYLETRRAPRMVLGEDAAWFPERVYSRAAGYCG